MNTFFISVVAGFLFGLIGMPVFLGLARLVGFYAIVNERRCNVYVLFGKVIDILEEPGLYFLWTRVCGRRNGSAPPLHSGSGT